MALETLNVCCNRIYKAIPLAFDESLSYLEMLGGILNNLNETIEQVQSNTNWINNYEGSLDSIYERLDIIESNVAILTTNVNVNTQAIATLRTDTINMINDLNNSLRTLINNNYDVLKSYIDTNVVDLQYQIDNINIGATMIYNPYTGLQESVQDVINYIYQSSNKDGLTCLEFDGLELSATQFDNYEITASQFDSEGKTILV